MVLRKKVPKKHFERVWKKKSNRFDFFRSVIAQRRGLRVTKQNLMYMRIKHDMPHAFYQPVMLYQFLGKRGLLGAAFRVFQQMRGFWPKKHVPHMAPSDRGRPRTVDAFLNKDDRYALWAEKNKREYREYEKREILYGPVEDTGPILVRQKKPEKQADE